MSMIGLAPKSASEYAGQSIAVGLDRIPTSPNDTSQMSMTELSKALGGCIKLDEEQVFKDTVTAMAKLGRSDACEVATTSIKEGIMLVEAKIRGGRRSCAKHKYTAEEQALVVKMYEAGMPVVKIMERVSLTYYQVYTYVRRAKITQRPKFAKPRI